MPRPIGLPKTGGRKKGTPNKATQTLRNQFQDLPQKLLNDLGLIESPKERAKIYLRIMDFIFPKPRVETDVSVDFQGLSEDVSEKDFIDLINNAREAKGTPAPSDDMFDRKCYQEFISRKFD